MIGSVVAFYLIATLCAPSGKECQDFVIRSSQIDETFNEVQCDMGSGSLSSVANWLNSQRAREGAYEDWKLKRVFCQKVKSGKPLILKNSA